MQKLNTRDIASLSPEFFIILEDDDDYILFISNFTSQKWKLVYSDCHILMYHAHKQNEGLHYQTECLDVYNAILYILDHEDFQLNSRKKIRTYESRPMEFNRLLMKTYGLQ